MKETIVEIQMPKRTKYSFEDYCKPWKMGRSVLAWLCLLYAEINLILALNSPTLFSIIWSSFLGGVLFMFWLLNKRELFTNFLLENSIRMNRQLMLMIKGEINDYEL